MAYSPDATYLAVITKQSIELYDVASGKPKEILSNASGNNNNRVAFAPDGSRVATVGESLRCWDMSTGRLAKSLVLHQGAIWALGYSSDSKMLATGGEDTKIHLMHSRTGEVIRSFVGHTELIRSVAFTPNGRFLISSAGEKVLNPGIKGELKVWEVATGRELAQLVGFTNVGIGPAAISPDGTVVAASSSDVVSLWAISTVTGPSGATPPVVAALPPPAPSPAPPHPGTPPVSRPDPKPETVPSPPPRNAVTPPVSRPDPKPEVRPTPPPVVARSGPPKPELWSPQGSSVLAPGSMVLKRLPGTFSTVVSGGGGRLLIFALPRERQIVVFDLKTASPIKYIPWADEAPLLAASRDRLFIFSASTNLLKCYDLRTLELLTSVPSPLGAGISEMLLGSASRGPLYLFGEAGAFGVSKMEVVDPYTLQTIPISKPPRELQSQPARRVSAHGKMLTSYHPHSSPQGHSIHMFHGTSFTTIGGHSQLNIYGQMSPGPEGQYVYTANGVLSANGQPVGRMGSYSDGSRYSLPAAEGESFYLAINVPGFPHGDESKSGTLSLYLVGEDRPFATLNQVVLPKGINTWGRELFGHDRRFYLVPSVGVLAYLPPTNDCIEFHRLDLWDLLKKSPADYLVVTSLPPPKIARGQTYRYTPTVLSKQAGATVRLEYGPEGMRLVDNALSWPVPPAFEDGTVDVLLVATNSSGKECFQKFQIEITREP